MSPDGAKRNASSLARPRIYHEIAASDSLWTQNLLYLSVNTMYSYMEFILLSEYQMRAEGRGGVGIPRCENTNLYFMWWKCKIGIFGWLPEGIFFFRIRINLLTGHPFSTVQRDFAEMGIANSDMLRDFLIEIVFLLQLTNLGKKLR